MKLSPTTNYEKIDEIMLNEELFETSMPDMDCELRRASQWTSKGSSWHYLHVTEEDGSDVGIIRLKPLSPVMIEFHWHLLPEYWGTGHSDKINNLLEDYVLSTFKVRKLVSFIPAVCTHTLAAAGRVGYEIEGVLIDGDFWRGQLTNQIIISKFIGETNG